MPKKYRNQTITDASLGGNTLKFVIRDLVQQLSTKYNTTNPYELADYLKIHVLTWDLHEEINGFINMKKEIVSLSLILICLHLCKRTVCAHELGHAVLHTHANTPFLRKNTFFSVDKLEIEANTFAALLLIDKRPFSLVIQKHV